ncbi:hypothetical protein Tco_0955294 [Tanacetum coccineum]|uniref:Uncharacterized protein n=1 Tax=Tanacetum coccineum TaxID=301880 RepID=A0ABQ5E6S4_9ASTR
MSINCLAYELYWNTLSRNMNLIATQQATLDNALVPSEKRLKIERCNARIAFSKPQREETYQVTLEALKLSHCYPAFVITAEICPKILNQDFTAPPSEEDLVTLIQELGYFGRCASLGKQQDSIDSGNHELKSCRQYGALIPDDMINQYIKDSQAYKTYYEFATRKVPPRKARKYKKAASPPRKLSPVKEAEPVKKAKRVKRPAKKYTIVLTVGVVLRDTPGVSVSKKKAPAKANRSKGIEILSDVALSEAAQLKEATKRSKKDFHISQAYGSSNGTDLESGVPDEKKRKTSGTNEGIGTIPGVPDVPIYQFESDDESWGNSKDENDDEGDDKDDDDDASKGDDDKADSDDDGNKAHDSERTDSDDDDENPSFTLKDYDEEEHDEEYESDDDNENVFEEEDDDDLYKDVHEVPSTQVSSPLTEPVMVIPDSSTIASTTVPPTILMITPLP